jgi:endonuclease III
MKRVARHAKVPSPVVSSASISLKISPKKKANYGLTPGATPYPDWPHPTTAECREVVRLLSGVHGKVTKPKAIPLPSLTMSGCGEVPSVLDALIRTRLSAATSNSNSSRAFRGLVTRFGTIKSGVGQGSVDWDAVRRADVKDIFEAIKSGGLADVKSKDIKKILDMVYEENQARRVSGKTGSDDSKVEQALANDEPVISLDHLHTLSSDEAFNELVKYPGIGPKTASCVLLFCLQRPSFAVDTHVFRLCKWLGWVPPNATRETTFSHCEVRIPDDLKYPLHKLLIQHGRACPRCRAITGESSEGWDQGCVIDQLVQRTGSRKGGIGKETDQSDESDEYTEAKPKPKRRRAKSSA